MKKVILIAIGVISASASLNAQTTLFEENFNGVDSMPASMTVINYNNDNVFFQHQQSGGVSGSKCALIGWTAAGNGNQDQLRFYPATFIAGETYTLKFSERIFNSNYPEIIYFGFVNTATNTWVSNSVVTSTSTSYQERTFSITPNVTFSGIAVIGNQSYDAAGWYVDDISVTVSSQVSVVTSPASQITKNSAVSGGTITNPYNEAIETVLIRWGLMSTGGEEEASQPYSQNSYSIIMPNLLEATDYWVRASVVLESGDTIEASEVEYFTTLNPCANDDEVFLSNLAFIDETTAASFGTYFVDYELPEALNYDALNPNNFLNPGLPVSFKVQCSNRKVDGSAIVSGECRLRTSDSQITILDSISGLNNVGWGSTAWSTDEFKIQVSSSVTESFTAYVDFVVIENGEEYVTRCIPIPVKSFAMNQNSIDDDANPDSDGDGDGIVEPGERIETLPTINNNSEFESSLVAGFLRNLKSYSGIEILNDIQGSSGTIYSQGWYNVSFGSPAPMNAGQLNSAPEYDFVFDYDMDATYSFQLDLIVAGGFYLFKEFPEDTSSEATLIRQSTPIYYNSGFPVAVTGIQDNLDKSSNVSIYPNPTNGKISISSEDGQFGSSEVQLFSSIGQLVLSKNDVIIGNNPTEIDLSALPKGVYTLVIAGQGAMSKNQIVLD